MTTLAAVLEAWAERRPDELAYGFLDDGEALTRRLSFAALRGRAYGVAAALGDGARKRPVILLCDAGLDFLAGFFGVLAAGGMAVPLSVPLRKAGLDTLRRVVADTGARHILTTGGVLARLAGTGLERLGPALIALETLPDAAAAPRTRPDAADVCLVQYTSGSTSAPKGVVLTHAQVLANQAMIKAAFGHDEATTTFVSWLPQFHDMGLIGNMLQPLYLGRPSIFFAPAQFLQRPLRWLAAISRFAATTSGAPNFAYQLCVDRAERLGEEALAGLDLSRWTVAYNGAEPARAQTMRAFAERFAPAGFAAGAFLPCYGLAEATLLVAAAPRGRGASERDGSVCLGPPAEGAVLAIADPDTGALLPDGAVGEILVGGPALAKGYGAPGAPENAGFGAQLRAGGLLRTGDLGRIEGGELYFAGRHKDMMVIRGRNYHSQDIERSLAEDLPQQPAERCVAFADERAAEPRLVVVRELRRAPGSREEGRMWRRSLTEVVARRHQLRVDDVLLVPLGTIPMTTSGKVKRAACRSLYYQEQIIEH